MISTLSKPKRIGTCACDSGQLTVIDPCYLETEQAVNSRYNLKFGTAFSTEIGDGCFPVYEQRNRNGKLCRIVIQID